MDKVRRFEPRDSLSYVLDTIRQVRTELDGRLPLIGFAGAPFTLASYAIEGGPSTGYARTKTLMYGETAAWHRLCEKLSAVVADYLTAQVEAGVQAVQLFDSWVGILSPRDYREFALPHTRRILHTVQALGVPVIHFGTGTATILADMREAGGDVIGVDWRIPLDEAWERIGRDRAVAGELGSHAPAGTRRADAAWRRRRVATGWRRPGPYLQPRAWHFAEHPCRACAAPGSLRASTGARDH